MVKLSAEQVKLQSLSKLAKGKHNGFKNWTTWVASLQLSNNERAYNAVNTLIKNKKWSSTNRSARAWVAWAAAQENFKTPLLKKKFVDSVSFPQIKSSF